MANMLGEAKDHRRIGLWCAVVAGGLGLAYMSAAGAPFRYIGINVGALALGLATYGLFSRLVVHGARAMAHLTLVAGVALFGTAVFGLTVEGASRWIGVGPLTLQPSLILVPVAIVAFSCHRDATGATGLCLAALALALQPDRAMTGVLAGGLLAVATISRDRWSMIALIVATCAFAATLVRADNLPAVPFVDGIFYSAFAIHALAGAAVIAGACLLVVPAAYGLLRDSNNRLVHATFGATWLGIIAAAALGNYPTPVVGYGGSAIVGYLFSLSLMSGAMRSAAAQAGRASDARIARDDQMSSRLRAAATA